MSVFLEIRMKLGWTQNEVAEKIFITARHVRNLESDEYLKKAKNSIKRHLRTYESLVNVAPQEQS